MKTSCGKFLNLAHYFPSDVKLRLLAHSRSVLANQNARNAIVGAENLLMANSRSFLANQKARNAIVGAENLLKVNRHFLENERGDLSFFFCCIELSSEFLFVK